MEKYKFIVICIPLILFSGIGFSQEIYVYPEIVEVMADTKCACSDLVIKNFTDSIKKELYSPYMDSTYIGIIEIKKIDLNNDSKCELMLLYKDRGEYPNYTPFKIFEMANNNVREIGFFLLEDALFAEKYNGYSQILSMYYEGHKTNPIYYLEIYRFDGKSYSLYKTPHLTRGQYMNLGKQSYKNKNYADAEKYYYNAYIMSKVFHTNQISDANNLALAWIKLKNYEKAKSILLETTSTLGDGYYSDNDYAPVYYNLGLIAEFKGNIKEALYLYQKAYSLEPSDARMSKINLMKKKINGQ